MPWPGRMHDATAVRSAGIDACFRYFPEVEVLLDDGYLGLRRDHPGKAITPPRKPNRSALPEFHERWKLHRHAHSSDRITVEHALADHKRWKQLMRDPSAGGPPGDLPGHRRAGLRPHRERLTSITSGSTMPHPLSRTNSLAWFLRLLFPRHIGVCLFCAVSCRLGNGVFRTGFLEARNQRIDRCRRGIVLVEIGFELGRRNQADLSVQAAMVEPVHVLGHRTGLGQTLGGAHRNMLHAAVAVMDEPVDATAEVLTAPQTHLQRFQSLAGARGLICGAGDCRAG